MARKRSRTRSTSRRKKSSRASREFVCPYKKNGQLVKKMSKSKLVSSLLKELKIKSSTVAGKKKKAELKSADTNDLRQHLHGILNAKHDKIMKVEQKKKIKDLVRRGIIVKRTPKEKAVLRAMGMGPGGPNSGQLSMKIMVCKNGQCQMHGKTFQGGGCPSCGTVGTLIT